MAKVLIIPLLLATAFSAAADELSVARQALRDGLWDVARTHAVTVATDEARLVVLESWAGEGKWDEIRRCLDGWKDAKGDGFDYYRAVLSGDHQQAMEVLKRGGSPEGLVEARLYEADELFRSGRKDAARQVWREIAGSTNVSERALALSSANLMEVAALRRASMSVKSSSLRRMLLLRLGLALLVTAEGTEEGERIIRAVVKDAPDADGARTAFLQLADRKIGARAWAEALALYRESVEVWPEAAKTAAVQEGMGWALAGLSKREEALAAFVLAESLATDDEGRARAIMKQGDVLAEMDRSEESMARYRLVKEKYAKTTLAARLEAVIKVRETEAKGVAAYRAFDFRGAMACFASVAAADPARRARMELLMVQCLYGQGRDDEAVARARELVNACSDDAVRVKAEIWLAKLLFNRRDWKESERLFLDAADVCVDGEAAAESLLWAARAAFADNDFEKSVLIATGLVDRFAESKFRLATLLVQGEALLELGRFDEALLIFERVVLADGVASDERTKAQVLKADALYTMGADDPSRYTKSLEAYRAVRFGDALSPSVQLVISFKIARVLEKLKRTDEAVDQYYTQVVLAYRDLREKGERLTEEARAVFSRAAFRLADEFENRGKDGRAASVLELVVQSDVPAAAEARKRLERILSKGRIL